MSERRETALFLFAHQDDEFGVFWEIAQLVEQNVDVHIAYLTSGSTDGNISVVRNAESIKVLRQLGVRTDQIHFLGAEGAIPDGKLHAFAAATCEMVVSLVRRLGGIDYLYLLAWEGGRQDHDAAHLIGLAAIRGCDERMLIRQFSLYHGEGLPGILFRLCAPLKKNGTVLASLIPLRRRLQFLAYVFHYPSQIKTWVGLFPLFFLHHMFSGKQFLQPVSLNRCMERPHDGPLLYERRGFASFADIERCRTQLAPVRPEFAHRVYERS